MLTDALNRPLRDLRISVTDRCNFRCLYCMPEELFGKDHVFLPPGALLSYEEMTRIARVMAGLGVVKLRLTGGEPLLRRDIEKLVAMLAQIDGIEDIAMTTNAYFLPQKAQALKDAGLRRVTVSLDTLDDAIFRKMNGHRGGVADILNGLAAAEQAGFGTIKINTVVQRDVNAHTVLDLARYCKDRGYIVRFIEYMDVGTLNGWRQEDVVSADEIVAMIDAEMPVEPIESNYPGEVARRYRYRDGGGEIGFVTSVTRPFCGTCNRVRLSPEGTLYTCLFATGGTDLRAPLRAGASDADLAQRIREIWTARRDRYSELRHELRSSSQGDKVEMYHIGG